MVSEAYYQDLCWLNPGPNVNTYLHISENQITLIVEIFVLEFDSTLYFLLDQQCIRQSLTLYSVPTI